MAGGPYKFGRYSLTSAGRLLLDDQAVPLGSKSSEILRLLLDARGALVTKEGILAAVWPELAIDDNVVQVHISALRRALGDLAPSLVTVRGLGYRFDVESAAAELPSRSVAVLPFANLTGHAAIDKLAEGLTEELIGTLSKATGLAVWGRVPSARFSRGDSDLRTIGRELGVATVLDGSIRDSASQLRVIAELIDAATGFQLWAECYDAEWGDALILEAELAAKIGRGIHQQLAGADGPQARPLPSPTSGSPAG